MSTILLHGTCSGWLRVQLCFSAHISDIVSTHLLQPKENAVNALSSSNKPEFIFMTHPGSAELQALGILKKL